MNSYQVLLYYKYTTIDNPEQFATEHLAMCKEIGLKGRILVAEEGINGTVSGTIEETEKYIEAMHADPRFADMVFKIDAADKHAFQKMHVRPRTEIVSLSLENDVNPLEVTGNYMEPEEFREALKDENTVILDARNDYEFDLGHFRGAIRPDITAFRDLPDWVEENRDMFEDKKIVTYCTGGIRCEKFSGWLKTAGFDDVSQLHGGIATYGKDETVKGDLWDGMMYVFDERIAVPINRVDHTIVGKDYFDGTPCERYINCANPYCNKQILASEENEEKYLRSCSHECRVHPANLYVKKHALSQEELEARIANLEETVSAK
ncbi:rhodanese-related sulfurtransferase [Listeria booriae]|uniref:oxygen-dependent tRNA uridine(34) hydroxylase TrhO n=1 Tax=Listeria booriae TaxID=1552123 RepID=UPI001624D265|nr:rhodanese-related sulfurtransferase [Listeria booriae]MBC1553629.1 rhodanese-related sulfurtransferase [Listeria booriae]MBC1974716.1 rhodanese-related sulfurtransferase [Listeria booriae]MBC2032008.1 rhodanese-related sulfurtransferase [Listeria booriae]MBC2035714.1 rhodanese-related sulfurtransferase [Listeria booriae]MBC2325332.1 rhodanese-related sulfurtransferase [Listeria booriae]